MRSARDFFIIQLSNSRVDILYKADVEKASFVDYLKKAGKRFLKG